VLDRRSFVVVLAACALATVVVVSTIVPRGSDEPLSAGEYRQELAEALDGFDSLDMGPDAMGELAGKFRSAGDRLDDVVPPADAQADHDRLVAGLTGFGERLAEVEESGREGVIEFQMDLAENQMAGLEWIEAFNALAAKGYLSGPTSD
jgi:hypothetical protein